MKTLILLTLLIQTLQVSFSARILCIFPIANVKELEVYRTIWTELAKRHEVTIITPNVLHNTKQENVTLHLTPETALPPEAPKPVLSRKISAYQEYYVDFYKEDLTHIEKQLAFHLTQKMMADKGVKFDVVLADVRAPAFFGFAAKYECPLIGYSPTPPLPHIHQMIGNPVHPISDSDACPSSHQSTFFQRLGCVYLDLWIRYFYNSVALRIHNSLAKKYIGSDIPAVGAIERNMSLMFVTSNFFIRKPRANALSIVEVDRLHIKSKKPLPGDLQAFLDGSTDGVLYVNLSPAITDSQAKVLMEAFAKLPLKVLWMYKEKNSLVPVKNVLIRNYVPQQDVLGHPNVKAFLLQGDIMSIEEAIVNRVPMVVVPFSAEEIMNVKRVEDEGLGLAVGIEYFDSNELREKLLDVAKSTRYSDRVNAVADILDDEPMNSLEKIVWWVEYVARNDDLSHLKVPSKDMPWVKFLLVDVLMTILLVLLILVFLIYWLVALCCRKVKSVFTGRQIGPSRKALKKVKKSV